MACAAMSGDKRDYGKVLFQISRICETFTAHHRLFATSTYLNLLLSSKRESYRKFEDWLLPATPEKMTFILTPSDRPCRTS